MRVIFLIVGRYLFLKWLVNDGVIFSGIGEKVFWEFKYFLYYLIVLKLIYFYGIFYLF